MPPTDIPAPSANRELALAEGRARRSAHRRSSLADHATGQRDLIAHLRDQNAGRVPELVGLRMQRMLADPFAFYRGSAGLMAADLAGAPSSTIMVASCGDAHVTNFGFYASPERRLVFDLNDFDEAAIAPWEWDVKRLVTSAVIGGRQAGYAERAIEDVCLSAGGLHECAAAVAGAQRR